MSTAQSLQGEARRLFSSGEAFLEKELEIGELVAVHSSYFRRNTNRVYFCYVDALLVHYQFPVRLYTLVGDFGDDFAPHFYCSTGFTGTEATTTVSIRSLKHMHPLCPKLSDPKRVHPPPIDL